MNTTSLFSVIDAIPAHLPEDGDQAVLMAKVVAFDAISRSRRCARALNPSYLDQLSPLYGLVSIGMIDKAYVDIAAAEIKTHFDAAMAALLERKPEITA